MTEKTHGGARKGAGRRKLGKKLVGIRLTPAEHLTLIQLGGSEWLEGKLERIMTNVNEILEKVFDKDLPLPEQFTDAYWRVTDEKQIAELGISADDAKVAAKEIRRRAELEIEKRAADYLANVRRVWDDEWARLLAFSPVYAKDFELSDEDEHEDWWTQGIKDKIIDGVCADWNAVRNNKKYVFERSSDHGYDLSVLSLELYCDRYRLKRSDELVESILDFNSKEDALDQIAQFEKDGEIDAETAADLRREANS